MIIQDALRLSKYVKQNSWRGPYPAQYQLEPGIAVTMSFDEIIATDWEPVYLEVKLTKAVLAEKLKGMCLYFNDPKPERVIGGTLNDSDIEKIWEKLSK